MVCREPLSPSITDLQHGRTDLLRSQFETNVFGLMDVTLAGLPYLREHRGSTLVLIGSRSAWKTTITVSCMSYYL